MVAPNPMGKIFTNIIKNLEKDIHKYKGNAEQQAEIRAKLEQHLIRAQRHEMSDYDAEVRYAMGLQYSLAQQPAEALRHYEHVLQYAIEAGDQKLELRMRGNISLAKHNMGHYSEAYQEFKETAAISEALTNPEVDLLYRILNILKAEIRRGDWDSLRGTVERFNNTASQITVTSQERQDYGRALYFFRYVEAILHLGLEDLAQARIAIDLAQELEDQLGFADRYGFVSLIDRVYHALAHDKLAEFMAWYEATIAANKLSIDDWSAVACIFQQHGQHHVATQIATDVLNMAPNSFARNNLQADFVAFGIHMPA